MTDWEIIPPTHRIPAIPPEDYKGTQADWMVALRSRGLWDDTDGSWYGDVYISQDEWWEILAECERDI
jgi:hypothetical protein